MGIRISPLLQKRQRIRKPNQRTTESLSPKPEESKPAAQECFMPGQKIEIQGANYPDRRVEEEEALGTYERAEDHSHWINTNHAKDTILTLRDSKWIIRDYDDEYPMYSCPQGPGKSLPCKGVWAYDPKMKKHSKLRVIEPDVFKIKELNEPSAPKTNPNHELQPPTKVENGTNAKVDTDDTRVSASSPKGI